MDITHRKLDGLEEDQTLRLVWNICGAHVGPLMDAMDAMD